jgi:hypothetical protein
MLLVGPIQLPIGASLRKVSDRGEVFWEFRCPVCRGWWRPSQAQFDGREALDCPNEACVFSERHHLARFVEAWTG